MTLKLRVTWPHAGHPLLPEAGAAVTVTADGSPLTPTLQQPGKREFEIPPGTGAVHLTVSFTASFGPVGSVSPMSAEVLRAEQPFTVVDGGTRLEAEFLPEFLQHHPLIDTKSIANVNGAVLAQVYTDFVNIGPFWKAYADDPHLAVYNQEHHPQTELVALGYTGGDPKIWFASIPDTCLIPPNTEMFCLVFFRPENDPYSRIDQQHSMFRLNRYLLSQVPGDTNPAKADVFRPQSNNKPYIWLRCGFEEALHTSRIPVVMLHPWPNVVDYGHATTNRLPGLAHAALRLLWAQGHIAVNRADVRLGRLGIAGYSAGGLAMWQALRNNKPHVRELYVFDAVGTPANKGHGVQWLGLHPSNRLRMTGGAQLVSNEAARRLVEQTGGDLPGRFTAVPPDAMAYRLGINPHWDNVTELLPQLQLVKNAWHQFAIFGSYPGSAAPPHRTFLQQFLEESGF